MLQMSFPPVTFETGHAQFEEADLEEYTKWYIVHPVFSNLAPNQQEQIVGVIKTQLRQIMDSAPAAQASGTRVIIERELAHLLTGTDNTRISVRVTINYN